MFSLYNHPVPARLILNADDFGLTPGINRAVIELHQAGCLTSATLMAAGPAFEEAAALARQNPTLGIGCHLVFVDGTPITAPRTIPTLCPDGKRFRPSLSAFVSALLRGAISPAELIREAPAQILHLQHAGIPVTHLDTHKHTHIFPRVLAPILVAAQACNVPALRNPFEPRWAVALTPAVPRVRRTQVALLRALQPAFKRLTHSINRRGLLPAGTLGIAATGTLDESTLRALIPTGDVLYELCCHPGYQDSALDQQNTRLRTSRKIELRAFLNVIPQILQQPIPPQLIHYGDLQASPHESVP